MLMQSAICALIVPNHTKSRNERPKCPKCWISWKCKVCSNEREKPPGLCNAILYPKKESKKRKENYIQEMRRQLWVCCSRSVVFLLL